MSVGGREPIVREPDGVHLNDAGARVAASAVLRAVDRDFGP
jgi:lysophospholipase L1-like esterase